MLKQYRNSLLQIIQEKGLDPKLFHAKEKREGDYDIFHISLINTPLIFTARNSNANFHDFDCRYTVFSPRFNTTDYEPEGGWEDFDGLTEDFNDWLQNHVKLYIQEQAEPDLWARIESQTPLVNGAAISQEDTNVFSDDEKIRVRMSINEFRILLIKNFKPKSEEIEVINDRLEYLSNSVDRLNKIDWRSVAITTLIAISTTLSLDTEKGRLLFDLFKQIFSSVLQLMQ